MIGLSLVINNAKNVIGDYLYTPEENKPQISFFKYVLRKNTNFFITNTTILDKSYNISNLLNINDPIDIKNVLSGDIDLLSNLYISFYLPDIYSNDKLKFKWVDNIAALLIKKAVFTINSQEFDSFTGEWLCIWNELTSPTKDAFNKMSGNSIEITNPRSTENIIRIRNNIISDFDYPSSDKNNSSNSPSISSKWVTIQLPFWFTKSPSLALPIFGNIYANNNMSLNITFENIEKLYTVYSDVYNINISPSHYNYLNNTNININNFIKNDNIIVKIIATTITLDSTEKEQLAKACSGSDINYMIETVRTLSTYFEPYSTGVRRIDIISNTPIKQLVWTLNRADAIDNFNDILNYSYNIPFNNEYSIMKNAAINVETEELYSQEAFYYNKIQPYQYFNTIPKQGIYLKSFSLFPDKSMHSGSFNTNNLRVNITMMFNKYEPSILDNMYEKKYKKKYIDNNTINIRNVIYITEYNFINIVVNTIGLKFVK